MTDTMARRRLTESECTDLRFELNSLVWQFALRAADLSPTDPPIQWDDENLGDDRAAQARLAKLAIIAQIRGELERLADSQANAALEHGAGFSDLAAAFGITRQAAEKKWGYLRRAAGRVAVVISRRNRVHTESGDPRGTYGEVGGSRQYESDRAAWSVGKYIRENAEFAIIGVDGTVSRVYALDPNGWAPYPTRPDKWMFTAPAGRPLTDAEIRTARAAGKLPLQPGDDCPTRAGGAYRPHWF